MSARTRRGHSVWQLLSQRLRPPSEQDSNRARTWSKRFQPDSPKAALRPSVKTPRISDASNLRAFAETGCVNNTLPHDSLSYPKDVPRSRAALTLISFHQDWKSGMI